MEEIDKIVIQTLQQIGCNIEEEVKSLQQFDSDMIVSATVSCLRLIQPHVVLPESLPQNMAARYRIGQDMAQACLDIGYPGEIGYQTFLYFGESDVRKVLMFLIEKLPKEQEKLLQAPTESEQFLNHVKCKVKDELLRPWLPVNIGHCLPSNKFSSYVSSDTTPSLSWAEFWSKRIPSSMTGSEHLIATLVSLHARGLLSDEDTNWFDSNTPAASFLKQSVEVKRKPPLPQKPKLGVTARLPEGQIQPEDNKEDELERKLTEQVKLLAVDIDELLYNRSQMKLLLENGNAELGDKMQCDALRSQIVELLPENEANIPKLQQKVEASAHRLVNLAAQWEKHRVPLIEKYRHLCIAHSTRINESAIRAETAKSLRERRKELEQEIKKKEKILTQLEEECQRSGKEVNRSAYTRRIYEIISNIQKQRVEVDKVLKDTRVVQKEINTLTGQLDRSFAVADETIFRDAKKDEASRRAYKLLATLHADCNELVAMVQDTGAIHRETRDLEEQIDKEKAKKTGANLERISADLNQMKAESAQLTVQLQLKHKTLTHS